MTPLPAAVATDGAVESLDIEFVAALPGFPELRRFRLLGVEGIEPFCLLRSLEVEGLEFVVVPPAAVFSDYAVELEDDAAERLELTDADDALVLVIVTVGDAAPTANLLGPLVVNRRSRRALQVVLHRSDHGVSVPLG